MFGLSSDKRAGVETFLVTMHDHMSDRIVFDYVLEGCEEKRNIHQEHIDKKGSRVFYTTAKSHVFRFRKEIKDIILKNGYDTIYFNCFALLPFFSVIRLGVALKKKVFVHAHNNQLHDKSCFYRALNRLCKWMARRMPIIRLTNSPLSAKFFFGKAKAIQVNCAIDTKLFAYDERKRALIRNRLDIFDNEHLYGFAGRLAYQKDPLFLIEVFYYIKQFDKDAKFIICGDGEMRESVEQKGLSLGLELIMAGNVDHIEEYYSAMDLFLLPSRFEGLGIVLVEAQDNGLICLTTEDVVPSCVALSGNVFFLSKNDGPSVWAELSVNLTKRHVDRSMYFSVVANSQYNIVTESKR